MVDETARDGAPQQTAQATAYLWAEDTRWLEAREWSYEQFRHRLPDYLRMCARFVDDVRASRPPAWTTRPNWLPLFDERWGSLVGETQGVQSST